MSLRRKCFLILISSILLLGCKAGTELMDAVNYWAADAAPMLFHSYERDCEEDGVIWVIDEKTGEGKCEMPWESPIFPESESPAEGPAPSIDELPGEENPAPALTVEEELPGEVTMVGTVTVRLIPLDVRTLANPPEIIAIAQYTTSLPPPSVTIESVSNLWKSADGEKVALYNGGDWIEATCHDPSITAVGVRFESDANDGWVSVLVDGVEMWRGNIHGGAPGSEEGMFLHYLEISGLKPGVHTIRVENLGIDGGEGGDDAAMRYFGFSSTPVSGYEP